MSFFRRMRSRAWLAGLAVGALVALQSLGLMHGVLHAHGQAAAVEASAEPAPQGLAALFADHQRGDNHCQLYDQLAHADLAAWPVLALPCVLVPALPALGALALPAFERALNFQARGPPVFA